MSNTAATFCATLVDEWVRAGVLRAFAAPGSRSTPLALALAAERRLPLEIFHDERSAGFAAIGHALATGQPSVVTCTSGTAAAHFHAAVIEADLAAVPLIVCTTDRPPELWDIGAPQTVDQSKLFGRSIRFYAEPGVPTEDMRGTWRSMAARTFIEARGASTGPGPVHINLSFRDPLTTAPGPLPPGRTPNGPFHVDSRHRSSASEREIDEVWQRVRGLSGVLVAGQGTSDPASVLSVGRQLGWPVVADHRSGCRAEGQAIAHFDQLLRSERFVAEANPDAVIRFGQPLASKVLSQWLGSIDADVITALPDGRWIDPERIASLAVSETGLARGLSNRIPNDYRPAGEADRWIRADATAEKTIVEHLAAHQAANPGEVTEPGIARAVVEGIPSGSSLVVASSMPIRDVEWFAPNRRDIRVYANRGANGIDGVVSTAIGVALAGSPTTLLIGDVAFLHDSAALTALKDRSVDLTIVVVDNDGGGIFSFLPQAELVAPERFEELFGTPHGTDLITLSNAHGLAAEVWPAGLADAEGEGEGEPGTGARVIVAKTNRAANVTIHEQLNQAVIDALDPLV